MKKDGLLLRQDRVAVEASKLESVATALCLQYRLNNYEHYYLTYVLIRAISIWEQYDKITGNKLPVDNVQI